MKAFVKQLTQGLRISAPIVQYKLLTNIFEYSVVDVYSEGTYNVGASEQMEICLLRVMCSLF